MRTDIIGWLRLQWDRAAAWACVLAGAVMLVIGWVGVSGTVFTAKQLPFLASNGLGGLFLLGTGAMLWLSADLRDEWRKLDRIEAAIREHGTAGLERPGATVSDFERRAIQKGAEERPARPRAGAEAVGRMS